MDEVWRLYKGTRVFTISHATNARSSGHQGTQLFVISGTIIINPPLPLVSSSPWRNSMTFLNLSSFLSFISFIPFSFIGMPVIWLFTLLWDKRRVRRQERRERRERQAREEAVARSRLESQQRALIQPPNQPQDQDQAPTQNQDQKQKQKQKQVDRDPGTSAQASSQPDVIPHDSQVNLLGPLGSSPKE